MFLIMAYFFCPLQISFVVHLPPLGFGVYQLLEVQSSEAVLADYNIYMRNSRQEKPDKLFKIKEMQNSVDNIILENSYVKLWFSGLSGLLEVRCIIFQNHCFTFLRRSVLICGHLHVSAISNMILCP